MATPEGGERRLMYATGYPHKDIYQYNDCVRIDCSLPY